MIRGFSSTPDGLTSWPQQTHHNLPLPCPEVHGISIKFDPTELSCLVKGSPGLSPKATKSDSPHKFASSGFHHRFQGGSTLEQSISMLFDPMAWGKRDTELGMLQLYASNLKMQTKKNQEATRRKLLHSKWYSCNKMWQKGLHYWNTTKTNKQKLENQILQNKLEMVQMKFDMFSALSFLSQHTFHIQNQSSGC